MEELREVLRAQQSTVPALVDAGLMHLIRCTCPQGGETLSGLLTGSYLGRLPPLGKTSAASCLIKTITNQFLTGKRFFYSLGLEEADGSSIPFS